MVKIEIKHRQCYDQDLMDVCDVSLARAIGELTGKKTVSQKDLNNLRVLGCEIVDLDEEIRRICAR